MKMKHGISRFFALACAAALLCATGCSSNSAAEQADVATEAAGAANEVDVPGNADATNEADVTTTEAAGAGASGDTQANDDAANQVVGAEDKSAGGGAKTLDATTDGSKQITAENAAEQGYQVFDGTVHVGSRDEIVALQANDLDPERYVEGTYAVLVFDEPTEVTGMNAGSTPNYTRSSHMIGIAERGEFVNYGDMEACEALNGQHVTIAAKTGSIMFPTDVRLPSNEPTARDIVVL